MSTIKWQAFGTAEIEAGVDPDDWASLVMDYMHWEIGGGNGDDVLDLTIYGVDVGED